MKNTNEHSDEAIKKLIKDEGLLSTSLDFTSRVMKRVENYSTASEAVYKPLIGMKGWIIILTSVIMLIACCIMILASGDYFSTGYLSFLEPIFGFIKNLEITRDINFGSIFIGAMVFISILILLTVDFVFNTTITTE